MEEWNGYKPMGEWNGYEPMEEWNGYEPMGEWNGYEPMREWNGYEPRLAANSDFAYFQNTETAAPPVSPEGTPPAPQVRPHW